MASTQTAAVYLVDSSCRVTAPADATVAPDTGTNRTVTLEVEAGETETVEVTCDNGTQSDAAEAVFAATDAGGCASPLGSWGHGTATAAPSLSSGPLISRSLDAGAYLIEIAPSRPVGGAFEDNWYKLRTTLPTGARTHADVQQVGNTGLGGAGMSLGRFLDARGSLIYDAHPDADPARADDPFYPSSPSYPWLPFTTDRCSIPPSWILHLAENAIDEAAMRLGPLGWLAAHFLVPNADEIADHPQFGGETVQFVYGCMRHDFNWRNLHRVKHHYQYDTPSGTWNDAVRQDADTRLGTDLVALCNANQPGVTATSAHYTWELPNGEAVRRCKRAAAAVESALGAVPFGWIGYDHD